MIGDSGAVAFCENFAENNTLTNLALDSNQISDIGAAALGACLSKNKTLRKLNLWFVSVLFLSQPA